ncbi:RHS repeat-associated core domain-containing protein, partial [Opacimonas viscosa]
LSTHSLFAQAIYHAPSHQGYTGHHELSDVGIVHMGGRIYDASLGRFMQADPFIQAPNNTQNFNRYSYVLNNPLRYTDPSGYNFFEKIARPFKNVFRSVFRAIGQTASKWLVNIGSMFCGPAYAACVAAGNYDIARAFGANKTGALRGAFSSGVMAYVGGPPSNINIVQIAADIVDPKIGRVVNFLYNGFDSKSFANTALNLTHEVKNYYVSKEIARFARKNGMTLQELNALLTLNSFVGKKVTGSRMRPSKDGSKNDIFGFTSRRGGLIENNTVAGYIGVLWDVNDTILGYQGLLDAVGHDFIVNGTGNIGNCHSLGTLTCNNLVARGYAESATLNSLPFGNIAVGANARQTRLGYGDPINFFGFGLLLNPLSHGTPCSGEGFGFECHGFDDNYSELTL